jgi:hypothetical protein
LEIGSNIDLIEKTWNFIDNLIVIKPEKRKPCLFIPLKSEAWRAFLYSGYSSVTPPEILSKLVDAYNLIHEINSIIELNNTTGFERIESQVISSPILDKDPKHILYIPALIRDKLRELSRYLREVEVSLKKL